MNTFRHSTSCPACGHRFIAWRVWQITRWSYLRCPHCEVRLTRKLDRQGFTVGLVLFALLQPLLFIPMPTPWQIAFFAVVFGICLYIDATTVRLVEVRRWRGVLGYDA